MAREFVWFLDLLLVEQTLWLWPRKCFWTESENMKCRVEEEYIEGWGHFKDVFFKMWYFLFYNFRQNFLHLISNLRPVLNVVVFFEWSPGGLNFMCRRFGTFYLLQTTCCRIDTTNSTWICLVSKRQPRCAMLAEQCGHAARFVLLNVTTGTVGLIALEQMKKATI